MSIDKNEDIDDGKQEQTYNFGKTLKTYIDNHIGLQNWIKFLMFIFILTGATLTLIGFYLISQTYDLGIFECCLILLGSLQ